MTMIATQDAFANGLEILDGATCEFMGGGIVVVRQEDSTKGLHGSVSMDASTIKAALGADEDGSVDGVSFRLCGSGAVLFSQFDAEAQDYRDVVLHENDLRKMLAVLEG